MFKKNEAKTECIVARPFVYAGKKYYKDDIFFFNPNNIIQRSFLRSGKIFQLPEEKYIYILCTKAPKEIDNKKYKYDDIVDFSNTNIGKRELFVRRGIVKKIILENYLKNKEEEEKIQEEIQNIIVDENANEAVEENIDSKTTDIDVEALEYESCNNLSRLAKNVNIKAKELKYQIKQKLDIEYNSYTQKITEEEFKKIVKLLKRKNIKWMR